MRIRALLASLLALGLTGAIAGLGTYMAFSATAANSGDTFASGTVALADNDSDAALYAVTNAKPTDAPVEKCIEVTYTGSLDATVRLYTTSSIGAVGPYLNLTITPGTGSPSFPGCTGFTPDAGGAIFTGTLEGFAAAHPSYALGLADNPGSATKWVTNDAVVYRFTLTLQNTTAAQGLQTGTHEITWEAQDQ